MQNRPHSVNPSSISGQGVPLSHPESPKNNSGGKSQIVIVTSDLQFPPKYLHCPRTGQYDLLGQILYSLGYAIPPRTRLPSQLDKPIPYFTLTIRDRLVDTPLSQSILTASLTVHPRELLRHANGLLVSTPYILVKG